MAARPNTQGPLEKAGFTDIDEEDVTLHMGRMNKDERLAEEGARSCGIAVQGLSAFAKSRYSAILCLFHGTQPGGKEIRL